MQWAKSGTLLHLAKVAYRLGSRVEGSSMELVCINAVLIISYLPEGTSHVKELLEQIWQFVSRSKRRAALGVYRLLLALMRIERFRNEALEIGFVTQLHTLYRKRIFDTPSARHMADQDESSEDSDNESTSSDEEIIDDLLNEQPGAIHLLSNLSEFAL